MEKSKKNYLTPRTDVHGMDCEAFLCQSPNDFYEGGAGDYSTGDLIFDNGAF